MRHYAFPHGQGQRNDLLLSFVAFPPHLKEGISMAYKLLRACAVLMPLSAFMPTHAIADVTCNAACRWQQQENTRYWQFDSKYRNREGREAAIRAQRMMRVHGDHRPR
jgi:hypothetical protein